MTIKTLKIDTFIQHNIYFIVITLMEEVTKSTNTNMKIWLLIDQSEIFHRINILFML